MNSLFAAFGALSWKPLLAALVLPPVSLLLTLLMGLWLRHRRPVLAGGLIVASLLSMWFSHCRVSADWLQSHVLRPPPALAPESLPKLKRELGGRRAVIVVLGGGVESLAPEYGAAHLSDRSLQRLHYGLWLSRRLDLPVLFSGGIGLDQQGLTAEATAAARLAEQDYGRPLRWLETRSIDTRGNGRATLPMLTAQGTTDVLLVTHAWHMPRALRAFADAQDAAGVSLRIMAAPMGLAASNDTPPLDWLPSAEGYRRVRSILRELVGLLAGA